MIRRSLKQGLCIVMGWSGLMLSLQAGPEFPALPPEQLAAASAFEWPLLAPRWLPADCRGQFIAHSGSSASLQYQCGDDSLPYSFEISVQPGFMSANFAADLRLQTHKTLHPWLGPLTWYQLRSGLQTEQRYYGLDPFLPPAPTRIKLPGFDASPLYYSVLISAADQLPPTAEIDRILASLDWLKPPQTEAPAD